MWKKINWLLIFLIASGLFLRFYKIEEILFFGWDQTRDAWVMKEMIVDKKFPLFGPRTGIGHFHLGPFYYYLLALFYFFTHLDPLGSIYFSVLASLLTMIVIFWVGRRVFGRKVAYFSVFIYAFCRYLIFMDRFPWNVSLVMAASALVFYTLLKIYQGDNHWFIPLGLLAGVFFHLHFTAVFIPPIIFLSLLWSKKKKGWFNWFLGALLAFAICFIPNLIHELQSGWGNYYKFREFLKYYYHGFHFRFMLYRLSDSLIMFEVILFFKKLQFLKYLLPLIFWLIFIVLSKKAKQRFIGMVFFFWFFVSLVGFTLYSGPLSDYYFLLTMPFAIYMVAWLTVRLKPKTLAVFLILFWLFWAYKNISFFGSEQAANALKVQRQETMKAIERGEKIEFREGDVKSYLYYLYTR